MADGTAVMVGAGVGVGITGTVMVGAGVAVGTGVTVMVGVGVAVGTGVKVGVGVGVRGRRVRGRWRYRRQSGRHSSPGPGSRQPPRSMPSTPLSEPSGRYGNWGQEIGVRP